VCFDDKRQLYARLYVGLTTSEQAGHILIYGNRRDETLPAFYMLQGDCTLHGTQIVQCQLHCQAV